MRIRSHIDTFYYTILIGFGLLIGLIGFWVPEDERWMVWLPGLAVMAILAWIIYGTYYVFEDRVLLCRSGPLSERIPYDRIKTITACANYYSSMATAHQRLEIRQHDKSFVTGTTYISPRNQNRFLSELLRKCPHLESK
jgi:hypothetical protein